MEISNIILNETIKVEEEIASEWLAWIHKEYLPIYINSDLVISTQINRIIQSDPDGAESYAIQYTLQDMAAIHRLHTSVIQKAQALLQQKYNGKYVIFRTMMEVMHIGN